MKASASVIESPARTVWAEPESVLSTAPAAEASGVRPVAVTLTASSGIAPTQLFLSVKVAGGSTVSVSVAELLPAAGSETPVGTATWAVFESGLLADSETVPDTV